MPGQTAPRRCRPQVADVVLDFVARRRIATLDITGGAPELNANFRRLVTGARELGAKVMDRCNLTILEQPGQKDLAEFLAANSVEVVASMPCYLQDNVERQRGKGVFDGSIRGLKKLNALGYGRDARLTLNLVYNPQGPSLPPPQAALEADYKRVLGENYGIVFNKLFVLANMPIQRFGTMLINKGEFDGYLQLAAGRPSRRQSRRRDVPQSDLGRLARLRLRLRLQPDARSAADARATRARASVRSLDDDITDNPIRVAGHCYGCTAGQGSSCGGALKEAAE